MLIFMESESRNMTTQQQLVISSHSKGVYEVCWVPKISVTISLYNVDTVDILYLTDH